MLWAILKHIRFVNFENQWRIDSEGKKIGPTKIKTLPPPPVWKWLLPNIMVNSGKKSGHFYLLHVIKDEFHLLILQIYLLQNLPTFLVKKKEYPSQLGNITIRTFFTENKLLSSYLFDLPWMWWYRVLIYTSKSRTNCSISRW